MDYKDSLKGFDDYFFSDLNQKDKNRNGSEGRRVFLCHRV